MPDQAGFSLVELLVSIVIMAEILVGLLIIFDSSSRLARAQTHVAELQQSLRVGQSELARFTRMVGRGGLPIVPLNDHGAEHTGTFPTAGPAVSVFNNVGDKTIVQLVDSAADFDEDDDLILPGSDALVLRGVFSTPMYYIDPPLDIGATSWLVGDEIKGTITLAGRTRTTGLSYWDYPQDIEALGQRLQEAKDDQESLALILRDTINPNAFVVVAFDWNPPGTAEEELTPVRCDNVTFHASLDAEHIPQCIKFNVKLDPDEAVATGPGRAYAELSAANNLTIGAGAGHELVVDTDPEPDFKVQLPSKIGSLGVLEEHRLYVRAEWEVPGNEHTRLTPVLARAEFLPGTNTQIDRVDIADNVLDLQIAVGADSDRETSLEGYGDIRDNGSGADEVLFNSQDDTDSDGTIPATSLATGTDRRVAWSTPRDPLFPPNDRLDFHFLRLNTLVQARFADPQHRAPQIDFLEDTNRGEPFTVKGVTHTFNTETDLRYRRRWLQTVVELRNVQ